MELDRQSWIDHVESTIRQHNVNLIRICVQDSSNISRARYLPANKFLENLRGNRSVTFPSALFSFDTSARLPLGLRRTDGQNVGQNGGQSNGQSSVQGGGYSGGPSDDHAAWRTENGAYPSWELETDLKTFGVLPYAPGVARIIADVVDKSGSPIAISHREVLRKVLALVEQEGYQVKGSFEYEFYAFRQGPVGMEPAWSGLQCFSETKQFEVEHILGDVLQFLADMGAGPEVANTEYGSGQFEVSHSPFWNMEIADMAFYYRSSIKEILAKKGYKASFMAKPVTEMSGSGAHLHHSLYSRGGENLFFDRSKADGLADICRWFIGGEMRHAKTIAALSNSTVNGYKRLRPGTFAPSNITWGYDNRSCMIRIPHGRGDETRIENRVPGADTDPYLSLAVILAAGLDGVKHQIEPAAPLVHENAYGMSAEPLPTSLSSGLEVLKHDEWAWETFGSDFLQHYIQLRQAENERFLQYVTDWERQEYEDIF